MNKHSVVFSEYLLIDQIFLGVSERIAALFRARDGTPEDMSWSEWEGASTKDLSGRNIRLLLPLTIGFAQSFDARTRRSALRKRVLKQNSNRLVPTVLDDLVTLATIDPQDHTRYRLLTLRASVPEPEKVKVVRQLELIPEQFSDWSFLSEYTVRQDAKVRRFLFLSVAILLFGVSFLLSGLETRAEHRLDRLSKIETGLRTELKRVSAARKEATLLDRFEAAQAETSLFQVQMTDMTRILGALPGGSSVESYHFEGQIELSGRTNNAGTLTDHMASSLPDHVVTMKRLTSAGADGYQTYTLGLVPK